MKELHPDQLKAVTGGEEIRSNPFDAEGGIRITVLNMKGLGYSREEALLEAVRYFGSLSREEIEKVIDEVYGKC